MKTIIYVFEISLQLWTFSDRAELCWSCLLFKFYTLCQLCWHFAIMFNLLLLKCYRKVYKGIELNIWHNIELL